MRVNAREETYDHIELFGKPALFTISRIDRDTVPEGFHCYDLRGSDNDPGRPATVENSVAVNHAGTVLTPTPVKFAKDTDYRRIKGKLNFLGEDKTLAEFCREYGLALAPDSKKFILRPASPEEAGLFYSQTELDGSLATVGHLRIDFGSEGRGFWSSWNPHNGDALNTAEFSAELDVFVDELRKSGPLKDLSAMSAYCGDHGGRIEGGWTQNYGFIAESEHYRYCLRCAPVHGDYQGYLYIYDKRQQELNMAAEAAPEQGITMGGMENG